MADFVTKSLRLLMSMKRINLMIFDELKNLDWQMMKPILMSVDWTMMQLMLTQQPQPQPQPQERRAQSEQMGWLMLVEAPPALDEHSTPLMLVFDAQPRKLKRWVQREQMQLLTLVDEHSILLKLVFVQPTHQVCSQPQK
jgi:hypothetical protein